MNARAASVQALVDELNPEQRRAVLHRGGPVLVLAGAGTGKTRVITVRIAHHVTHDLLMPEQILALTFTNKAAGEMAERVAGFLGHDAAAAMTVGTFHSLGLRIVEQHADRLGHKRGITLLDAADQAGAVRQCLKRLRIDPKRHDPKSFLGAISIARNARVTPEMMAQDRGRKLTARVYAAYLEWLDSYKALDFDDLILRAVQLLEEHDDIRARWQERYRTILVDEYQDTNLMQLDMMRMLAAEHRSLCVVGDDDQSIYGWRGATIENILQFEEHFPDATAIALTQNYRSTGHILDAANAVITNNAARREKSLWTAGDHGEPVRVITCKEPRAEASFVAAEIHRRHTHESRPFRDFGVLFRTAKQARPLEEALRLAGVPYRLVGAFTFYERKEVKDVLSYLKLVVNPFDEVSLLRIINFPQRGIGPKTLLALREQAAAQRIPLWDVVSHPESAPTLNGPQSEALAGLASVMRGARRHYRDHKDVAGLILHLSEATGAREAWIRDPTEGPGGEHRWKTIEMLRDSVQKWQERVAAPELKDWLRLVALDGKQSDTPEEADEVSLMTLHAAKGLEWPICFMVGCQEGIIPHQRILEDRRADVSEERRLFYVGITRAKRACFLTRSLIRPRFHGAEPTRPSRFLREIPAASRLDIDRTHGGGGEVAKTEAKSRFAALRERLGK